MLSGRVFVIGDFPYKQKQEIAELVRAVGGSLSTSVSSRTNYLIITEEEVAKESLKYFAAKKYGCLPVTLAFLEEAIKQGCPANPTHSLLAHPKDIECVINTFAQAASQVFAIKEFLSSLPPTPASDAPPSTSVEPLVFESILASESPAPGSVLSSLYGEAPESLPESSETSVESSLHQLDETDRFAPKVVDWADDEEDTQQKKEEEEEEETMPQWKRKILQRKLEREAQKKAEEERHLAALAEEAAHTEAERAALRAQARERQREEKARRLAELAAQKAERKAKRKAEVKQRRLQMEEERRKKREEEQMIKRQQQQKEREEAMMKQLQQLQELARKLVTRELRRAEWEEQQKAYLAQKEERMKNKREDNMKKLFVGGVLFDDITHACKNLTGELDQEKFEELRKGRTENLLAFFLEFGEIQEVKPFWNDRHAFIVFSSEKAAEKALSTLRQYEERKKRVSALKEKLKKEGKNPLLAPKPNFYVRWNKNRRKAIAFAQLTPEEREKAKETAEKKSKSKKAPVTQQKLP